MTEPIRLDKRLVELFSCSRREATLFIEGGWVCVDGVVIEEPQFKVGDQAIVLHDKASATPLPPVTLLLNASSKLNMSSNPRGDAHKKKSAPSFAEWQTLFHADKHFPEDDSNIRPLKSHLSKLTEVLPLEPFSSGLLVFTQDGRVLRKLTEDANKVEQEYVIEVSGQMPSDGLAQLNSIWTYDGVDLPPVKVSWQNETRLRFALKGLKAGQIQHMCNSVGLTIVSAKRLRIGRVAMGKLLSGQWRYLPEDERF